MKNKSTAIAITALVLSLFAAGTAGASTVNATFTADNFYALYYMTPGGTLNYVGHNETSSAGGGLTGGSYNWSAAENWQWESASDICLYVVAWDDNSIARGLLGKVVIGDETVYTAPGVDSGWQTYMTNTPSYGNPKYTDDEGNPVTGLLENTLASNPEWTATVSATYQWSNVANLTGAQWIWNPGESSVGSIGGGGKVQIFRRYFNIKDDGINDIADFESPVPEPASLSLLGLGLAGLMVRRMRRRF